MEGCRRVGLGFGSNTSKDGDDSDDGEVDDMIILESLSNEEEVEYYFDSAWGSYNLLSCYSIKEFLPSFSHGVSILRFSLISKCIGV